MYNMIIKFFYEFKVPLKFIFVAHFSCIKSKKDIYLPDLERKLYLASFEMKGEFPDVITADSLSEWYPEISLPSPSSSLSSDTSFINSNTCNQIKYSFALFVHNNI